jgi:hypothetical protein
MSGESPSSAAAPSGAAAPGEKVPLDYNELYEAHKHKLCRVVALDKLWEGKEQGLRTKAQLIDRELDRVLEARTLEEVHGALEEAGRNLQQLQTFRRVEMLVSEEPLVRLGGWGCSGLLHARSCSLARCGGRHGCQWAA